MDFAEEINKGVVETIELELDLATLERLCETAFTEGVCMNDIISYESMGKTDITDELPLAFFTPERSGTGAQMAGESFFKEAVNLSVKMAKAVYAFCERILKAIIKHLFGVTTGSSYKDTAKDKDQFILRLKNSYGTGLYEDMVRSPVMARDIPTVILNLATLVTGNAEVLEDLAGEYEKLNAAKHEPMFKAQADRCTSILLNYAEANYHSQAVQELARLTLNKEARNKYKGQFKRKSFGLKLTPSNTSQLAADINTAVKLSRAAKSTDIATLDVRNFLKSCSSDNKIEEALDDLQKAFVRLSEATVTFKKAEGKVMLEKELDSSDPEELGIMMARAEHANTLNAFRRYLRADVSALVQAGDSAKVIGQHAGNLYNFLKQNEKHL